VPAIEWARTRRPEYLAPAAVFGLVLAGSGIPLLLAFPALALSVAAAAAAGFVGVALVLAGRATSVIVSLVQVAQALALVPAAATISGSLGEPSTTRAALAAALYLVGSVLLVRSMIRARGDARFVAASIGFHAAGVLLAVSFLQLPYAVFAAGLLARAIALPLVQARLASGPRRLRPVHIGVIEIAASTTLVGLAFGAGF
jgi:hypothetical protein